HILPEHVGRRPRLRCRRRPVEVQGIERLDVRENLPELGAELHDLLRRQLEPAEPGHAGDGLIVDHGAPAKLRVVSDRIPALAAAAASARSQQAKVTGSSVCRCTTSPAARWTASYARR